MYICSNKYSVKLKKVLNLNEKIMLEKHLKFLKEEKIFFKFIKQLKSVERNGNR